MRNTIAGLVAAFAVVVGAAGAMAQNTNVRGVITGFKDGVISIKARDGSNVSVVLPETVPVAITLPFTLGDIKPGMTLGVTTLKRSDGTVYAIDVRPIPSTANLGLTPHDLQPNSTMTNGTFEGLAEAPSGNELTLNYKTGTIKVLVVPETAMSRAAPGARTDLKPGESIYVAARKEDDKLIAIRAQVSKDGIKPTQ